MNLFVCLEVDAQARFDGKWTDIGARHQVVVIARGILYEIGRGDGAAGPLLVEQVDEVDVQFAVFAEGVVDAREGLPSSREIERVGLIDILLADVSGGEPYTPGPVIEGRVYVDLGLVQDGDVAPREIVMLGNPIAEGGFEDKVLIFRVTQGAGEVQREVLAGAVRVLPVLPPMLLADSISTFTYSARAKAVRSKPWIGCHWYRP